MINMFSLIAGEVRNKQELFDEEARIMQMLLNVGYRLHEADAALTLMQTLVQRQADNFFGTEHPRASVRLRTMNSEERRRFTIEAFAFALKLTHLGLLSEQLREELLEKAMAVYRGQIGLDEMKTIVAMALFNNSYEENDAAFSAHSSIRNTAWN